MKPATRWGWTVAALAVTGAVLVAAFVLSFSGTDEGFYEREFVWLFWVNVAVALLLVLVLVFVAARLALRVKRGKFGSRLLMRLAGIFVLVGVLPGLVIYTVSYQFAARSIEAWFDVRLAGALEAGLVLGKGTLEALQTEAAARAGVAAQRLAEQRGTISALGLERVREQVGATELALIGASGQVLLTAGISAGLIAPERPAPALLRKAQGAQPASQIEGLEDGPGRARIRAMALLPGGAIALTGAEDRYVLLTQPLAPTLVSNALAVQAASSEYQQRALARDSLRRMYIGTLTLAMVLSVFGAVLLAIVLGNQIVRPLLLLADGVREVAAGDLRPKPVFASADELGGLTVSFASMTQQLSDARSQVEGSLHQVESAKTRLQTVLDNLSAGVIVFDRQGRIELANPGAERILRSTLAALVGRRLIELAGNEEFAAAVEHRFETTGDEAGSTHARRSADDWQESFELRPGRPDAVMLLARGAALPGRARLLVFDDITEVVSAQRSLAWAEVARRLAHEIKNPLTPIQLSAERLQMKLEHRLQGADQVVLHRSVNTIVEQVEAMKTLVNEFRDYARLPSARLVPLELNALVAEVLSLYAAQQEQGRLVLQAGAALPRILGDASQLRQVVHNLVQNALDAVADRGGGRVLVTTEPVRAEAGEIRAVRLVVSDNGPGFAEHVLKRAFEPYVTTKSKGTGLGLAVVKKIADEHRARIRLANLHGGVAPGSGVVGARVSLSFSTLHPSEDGTAARDAPTRQATHGEAPSA